LASQPQKIEVFDKETNLTTFYDSISAAAKGLNIPYSSISDYFARNQQKPYKGRYIFKKL
jgi:NUMOD1 domain